MLYDVRPSSFVCAVVLHPRLQVPRLTIDLATMLGRSVSAEEAKATCRGLDRCGGLLL